MADTADFRSEGKNSDTVSAKVSRTRYKQAKALGLCVSCHVREIAGSRTAYCYGCSSDQVRRTYKSGLRANMKAAGIDWENATSITPAQMTALLDLAKYG
jgi:hypothetical protein